MRFGRLTVTQIIDTLRVKCRCDCGNEVTLYKNSLANGSTQSCGCLRRERYKNKSVDITGKRFGILTVLDRVNPQSELKYYCRCDCGQVKPFLKTNLLSGRTRSCGCLKKKGELMSTWEQEAEIRRRLSRPLPPTHCYACGKPFYAKQNIFPLFQTGGDAYICEECKNSRNLISNKSN